MKITDVSHFATQIPGLTIESAYNFTSACRLERGNKFTILYARTGGRFTYVYLIISTPRIIFQKYMILMINEMPNMKRDLKVIFTEWATKLGLTEDELRALIEDNAPKP